MLFFCFLFSAGVGNAAERMLHDLDRNGTVTGPIRSMDRNTIDIYDENEKAVKRFVYLDPSSPYRAGERVRIYYDRHSRKVVIIKKMTVLEYSKGGQNLGYITKN